MVFPILCPCGRRASPLLGYARGQKWGEVGRFFCKVVDSQGFSVTKGWEKSGKIFPLTGLIIKADRPDRAIVGQGLGPTAKGTKTAGASPCPTKKVGAGVASGHPGRGVPTMKANEN